MFEFENLKMSERPSIKKEELGERDMMFLPEQDPEDMEMLWGLKYMERYESKWGRHPKYVNTKNRDLALNAFTHIADSLCQHIHIHKTRNIYIHTIPLSYKFRAIQI